MKLYNSFFALLIVAMSLHPNAAQSVAPLVIGGAAVGGALLVNPLGRLIDSTYAGNCKLQQLQYSNSQEPDDNEFLYESKEQFDLAQQGYNTSDHKNSGSGIGWECDNEICQSDKILIMPSGHVFKGKIINEIKAYKCNTDLLSLKFEGDHWVETDMPINIATPGGDSSGSTTQPTPSDSRIPGIPRNTVAPYLNALQDCKN